MPEASVSLEQSLVQRYPALVRALPEGDFRALIDAGNISVTLDTLLDADTRFIDVDVWSQIYNKFMQLDGNAAGRLARNEINRRWFQENSIDPASDEVHITVRASGTNPALDLRFSSIQLTLGSEGLLTLAGLDEALQVIPLNVIASEVGEQVMALGEAAELTLRSDRLAANVPSYAQRVRANFEDHSLDEIRHQIRNVRSLRQRAVQLSGNEIAAAYIQGLTAEYDTTLQTLESLLRDARRWHASHQPEMTNQEAYEWAGTELVTYAGREWEQGGLGYVTGGAGYAGGFVVALFEGLGNLFTFGYQSARGDIVTAYRRGHVSYTTMEELSEDAAIRSFAVGVVTVALTVATAGLGAGVAGAFGLARGTLGYAIVSGGTEGALINIGSLGYETLITESRPEFEDPYAQAIWQRGSHSAGEFALAGGLGFGMGGLLGARSYYRGLGQSSALALPEEAGLAQPEIFPGGELPPAWEIRPMGVDPSGMERYVGRHISGEIIELFINAQHTEGYIVRQATGEIFQYQAGTFTRAAGLLPGQTGAAAAAGEAGLTRAPLIIRGGGAIYVEGFGPPPGAAPAGTITPVLPAPSRAPLMLPRGVAPGQAPINVLPSRAPLPGQPAAYSLPLGESGTAGAILMNRGLRPADFNMSFIAEDPVMLQLWDSARTAARSTGRSNAYTRYLEAMTQGNSMTSQQLRDAVGVVQDRFLELARARGFDVATVHHWNFPLSRYPQLITDPRHLVPVFEQSQMRGGYHPVHQGGLHRLTTSNPSQPTAGPVAPVHEIVLPPE